MSGYVTAGLLWYIFTTAVASWLAREFDKWITRAHDPAVREATRRVVPTSFLVAVGVGGTELFRLVRIFPLVALLAQWIGFAGWINALLMTAIMLVDALSAYLATGLPMIYGDLHRETQALEAAELCAQARDLRLLSDWWQGDADNS